MHFFASFSVLFGFVAFAASETAYQHELNHDLDLAQGQLVPAMFDYQNRGYRLFVKELASSLNTITSLRKAVASVVPGTNVEQAMSLKEGVKTFLARMPERINNPSPNELLKGDALLLGQMDLAQKNEESRNGRPEKLKNLVMQIVAEEVTLRSLPNGKITNQTVELSNDLARKFYDLEQLVAHQKVPTVEDREKIVEITLKKIEGMKFVPDEIAKALFWTDRLNAYRMFAYSVAQMLPIDSTEKVLSYSKAMADFYSLFDSLYKFDLNEFE